MKIAVTSNDIQIIYALNDSAAAQALYAQLPLTTAIQPFSDNEMTFYPEVLPIEDTPLASGDSGTLAYYAPWKDVVLFYAPCPPNGELYELGRVIQGAQHIPHLQGEVTISALE